MSAARCLITLSDGFWWRMPASSDAITAAETLKGVALVVDVDDEKRIARLVRTIRGNGPARLAQWCGEHGYRCVQTTPPRVGDVLRTARPRFTA